MKPGWKTTEFWTSVAVQVIGLLLIVGVIEPSQSEALKEAVGQVAAGTDQVIGGIMMALASFGYSRARGEAKRNTQE